MTLVFSDPLQGHTSKEVSCTRFEIEDGSHRPLGLVKLRVDGALVAHRNPDRSWWTKDGCFRKVGIRMEAA